jgi:phosphoribosylglycinamide formyltransferase-1
MSAPASPEPLRVAVFASGRGSNLQALHQAIIRGALPAQLVGVFSDKAGSGALAYAETQHIAHSHLDPKSFATREDFDAALMQNVAAVCAELIVCAGFMRIISEAGIHAAPCPMINIHPALLPKYPGLHTHARALAAGDIEHGASVHRVEPVLDGGRILTQARIAMLPDDTVDTLVERVLAIEHPLLIATVRAIAEGRIRLNEGTGTRILWLNHRLELE